MIKLNFLDTLMQFYTLGWVSYIPMAVSAANALFGDDGGNQSAQNSAGDASQVGREQWAYYKQHYQPLETRMIGQAMNAGSPEEFARARGAANADVTGAFDRVRRENRTRMESRGLNPASPAYQSGEGSIDIAEGSTRAGALTSADNMTRNLAFSKGLDVVGVGRGIPGQATAGMISGANAMTNANNAGFLQNQQTGRNVGYGLQSVSRWFGDRANTINPATGFSSSGLGTGMTAGMDPGLPWKDGGKVEYAEGGRVIDAERTGENEYDATKTVLQQRGLSPEMAHAQVSKAMGRHRGRAVTPHMKHFAVGGGVSDAGLEDASQMGELAGPGTETSDSIPAVIDGQQPAALSRGEFVMNAGVLKLNGEQIMTAINRAGLEMRGGRDSNDIPINDGAQAYRSGGKVRHCGLEA